MRGRLACLLLGHLWVVRLHELHEGPFFYECCYRCQKRRLVGYQRPREA